MMTTPEKIASNGRNALQSTGPQTQEGKVIASKNATKHGLLARDILLPNESAEELAELTQRLREDRKPEGELERLLVDEIVCGFWRLRRLRRVESEIFAWDYYEQLAERAQQEAASYVYNNLFDNLSTSGTTITHKGKHEEALAQAKQLRNLRAEEVSTVGPTFERNARGSDAFAKLSRYETARERSLHRALHELQRLQAARAGVNVPPPVAVDVDIALDVSPDGPEELAEVLGSKGV